jgi:hypothetical protein
MWTRVRRALTRVWSALTRACSALTRARSALTRVQSELTRVRSALTRVCSALTRVWSALTRARSALTRDCAERRFPSPSLPPLPPRGRGGNAHQGAPPCAPTPLSHCVGEGLGVRARRFSVRIIVQLATSHLGVLVQVVYAIARDHRAVDPPRCAVALLTSSVCPLSARTSASVAASHNRTVRS